MTTNFTESEERIALRKAVSALGKSYGHQYYLKQARSGGKTNELWDEAGRLGYLGVSVPEAYGGGGAGIGDLAAVCEELCATGTPLLLMVVSPAICATVIARFGTDEQKQHWLPGFASGQVRMSFAQLTELESRIARLKVQKQNQARVALREQRQSALHRVTLALVRLL